MYQISTPLAPAAIGPYCQAVAKRDTLYVSGCIGLDAKTMQLEAGLEAQTDKALHNMVEILRTGGSSIDKVMKVTVFLTDMAHFARANEVFSKYFGDHKPARACVAVKQLPKNALFELDAIAEIGSKAAGTVSTPLAPAAIGPYCQAVAKDAALYVSGCIGLDAKTMQLEAGLEAQTDKALHNMVEILRAGGSSIDRVMKVTVFLTDMAHFARANEVFSKYFGDHKPARACVAVKQLPKNALFELDAIAEIGSKAAGTVSTPLAPAAIGPYCQAVAKRDTLYVSGCIGLDAKTMQLEAGLEAQTDKALHNMVEILRAGGSSIDKVMKVTVFLTDMAHFARANEVFSKYFGDHKPARACVAVKQLPKNALFELDAIALTGQGKL